MGRDAAHSRPLSYPFVPRSTRDLRPGQFWAVPLSDGRFACGRVAQLGGTQVPAPTRCFFAALQDWIGESPPTAEALAGGRILRWGVMHIRAITRTGGAILGERPLAADGIVLPQLVTARLGHGVQLLEGANDVRLATREEMQTLPVITYWGLDVIRVAAEHHLVRGVR